MSRIDLFVVGYELVFGVMIFRIMIVVVEIVEFVICVVGMFVCGVIYLLIFSVVYFW